MKNKHIQYFLLYLLLFSYPVLTKSQNPLSLYFLENVPQSSILNPAKSPRANFFIGIPGLSSIYMGVNTDIFGRNIIQESNNKYVTPTQADFDYDKFYKQIGSAANFSSYQTYAPLMLGFRTKKGYFTFNMTEKLSESLAVPKDLFSIIDKGIPDGSHYDFSRFDIGSQYYREFSFGYSFKPIENISIGIRAKFLQGIASIKSDIKELSLNTSVNQWDLNVNNSIYLYAPVYVSYDEYNIPSVDSIPSDMSTLIDKGVLNFSNPGFAVDMGVVYELNEGWELSASINDIGFITWRGEDLNTFNAKGSYLFDGIYIDADNIDSLDNAVDDLIDSVKTAINFSHGNERYNTSIGTKLYLGAQYRFNHYFSMGLLSRSVFAKNNFRQEFNLSANLNLYHILTTSVNYTVGINGVNTLGLGLGLRGGPFQFYLAMDYMPYKYYKNVTIGDSDTPNEATNISILPTDISNINIMFGINLVFGANGYKDKPMIDTYKEF